MPKSMYGQDSFSDSREEVLGQNWIGMITKYSLTGLRFETDRLLAISGIAQKRYKEAGGDQCLAELWRDTLEQGLDWFAQWPSGSSVPVPGCSPYIAPSWSWASVNTNIYYPSSQNMSPVKKYHISVIDAQVEYVRELDVFGMVSGGSLELEGVLDSPR